ALKNNLSKGRLINFRDSSIQKCQYRPFTKTNLYFQKELNEMQYQVNKIYPKDNSRVLMIVTSGTGARSGFSCLISDMKVDFQFMDNGQGFPLTISEDNSELLN
ncbi:TPA: hypothetical protein NV511_003758, partial [Acinetobacter baumannii]|nr:hypothetical protein [Acinetobacter baumannii]